MACEALVRTYSHQGAIDGVSVRIPALVGIEASHGVLKDIIRKSQLDSNTLELIGTDPGSIRPFVTVNEAAEILYNLATDFEYGNCLVIGPKDSISVREIAEIVLRQLNIKKQIKFCLPSWLGDIQEMYIDPCIKTKLTSEEAILKVLKEYKELKEKK